MRNDHPFDLNGRTNRSFLVISSCMSVYGPFTAGVLNLFLTADRQTLDNYTADHPGSAVKLSSVDRSAVRKRLRTPDLEDELQFVTLKSNGYKTWQTNPRQNFQYSKEFPKKIIVI